MKCSRCGKSIYQTKFGQWKHVPYHGSFPHSARPETEVEEENES